MTSLISKPSRTNSTVRAWILPILVNIVLPIVTYVVLTSAGAAEVPALLLSGGWPLAEIAATMLRQRHLDEFGIFVIVGIVAGVLTTIASDDSRDLFYKDSITTGVIGLVFLGTLAGRPLTFYLGRRFATDGSKTQRDWWDGLWEHPRFRMVQRRLGAAWGVALVVEAVVRAILTKQLGTTAMVTVNNIVPYLVIAVMIAVSMAVGKREQRLAQDVVGQDARPPTEAPGSE